MAYTLELIGILQKIRKQSPTKETETRSSASLAIRAHSDKKTVSNEGDGNTWILPKSKISALLIRKQSPTKETETSCTG